MLCLYNKNLLRVETRSDDLPYHGKNIEQLISDYHGWNDIILSQTQVKGQTILSKYETNLGEDETLYGTHYEVRPIDLSDKLFQGKFKNRNF